MQNDDFEWDEDKAARNLEKHGVSLETAVRAWDDFFCFILEDSRMDYGEDRYVIFGEVEGELLSVAYTFRDNRIRVISARKASAKERRFYYERS